ncbi:sensor histidine kinase [Paenibacillus alkaliterrae]|uniref:sensor histidine kinase n=1 Tax=Paenibacillus alkaliterrae TaxID=320909 RepID=UPI001F1A7C0B|nr:sensor histidine kinase [Paenibacillus alkaliterrae]MCF2938062.1 sensor histidine kinase [Paenibacillus alkaliterrae]
MPSWKQHYKHIIRILLLRDQSLMKKLLVFSALLVVLPMLFVGLISYRQSSQVLEREARDYSLQIIDQVQLYVEDYLRDFEINTLKIINHPDTVNFLRMVTREEVESSEIVGSIRNLLKNSAYSRSDILNITIILDDIQVVDSADEADEASVLNLKNEYWYNTIPQSGEPKIISRLIHWKQEELAVISVMKRIVSPQTLKPIGMLIIDVNYKRLQDVAYRVKPGKSGYLSIINEQGLFVYHPNFSLIGQQANAMDVQEMQSKSSGSLISVEKVKYLLTFSRSDILKWNFVTFIPYDELMSGTDYIGRTILLTTMVFMIIAYIFGIGFAASLVKPIKRLHEYIRRVEVGDFSGKVSVDSKDEIGLLSHGFNKMVERLSRLLEEIYFSKLKTTELNLRQKDTELKMLQAQINPHFLYNSLDTIRGMALQHDMDEISVMAASLARLLRYNVKEESPQVTVRQEVEIGEIYLRIQKYRFEEKLDYLIEIPDWALAQKIAKFTLQPLIENCIVHGLEPRSGTTQIVVSAEKSPGNGTFTLLVTDTGPGIHPIKLGELIQKLDQRDGIELTGKHIGLMNVHRRIRYIHGEEYGLFVESQPGEGTTVGIRLPLQTSSEGGS